jgi:hypothetical protein
MNLDARPRWRWLSRAMYAYFAVWLSVWLDRTALAVLCGGLIGAGALLASTAPDLRGMRESAEAAPQAISAASAAGLFNAGHGDFSAREPAGGRLALAVVDLDQTPLSRQLLRLLGASAALRLVDVGSDLGRGHDLLRQGRVLALLLLPERMQEGWLGPVPAANPPPADALDPTGVAAGQSTQTPAPASLELYGGAGALGRQRALLVALDQVLQAVPAPVQSSFGAPPQTGSARLGVVVMPASGAGAAGGAAAVPAIITPVPALSYGDAALLSPGWLPALLALPAAHPGTALLVVQQTLLVVLCMLFAHWSEQRGWPVRRNWNGYLGVWAAVTTLALLGCLFHLMPGRLAGWFDPAPGTRYGAMLVLLLLFSTSLAALAIWVASLLRYREGGLIGLALLTLPLLALAALPAPLAWAWPASPSAALPALVQAFAWLLPSTAAGHGLALLTEAGAGWADCTPDFAVLGAIGAVAVAAGLYSWREPQV